MAKLYPPSVAAPQVRLTASAAHRRGVVRLLLGLLGFAVAYLGLLVGCVAAPTVLVLAALAEPLWWLAAAPALPLFTALVFVLVRGLVHRPELGAETIEVSAAEHPRLFEFLERLAADAGAPMPDRVSLGAGVNAAMLRSSSALGLLFGGPRELTLGLGLVDALDLRELKAVLAHELGHFAQSSARVGQWAHRTTVVLRQLVLDRDRFDERLARAARSANPAPRLAARILDLGVVGLRSILAALLGRIARSNLALAREMEFNADLHAVALCGSDPLVAALWRAQRAALANSAAVLELRELGKAGLFSDDLYAHQHARALEFEGKTAGAREPMILALRREYEYGEAMHFPAGEAPAEVMGYSHPSYAEREANAKRSYVAVDPARWPSAWALFDDPAALRRRATANAYAQLGFPRAREPGAMRPAAELERRRADELAERALGRLYFGFYDDRIIDLGELDELFGEATRADPSSLAAAAKPWQGEALAQFMQRRRATRALLDRLAASLREGRAQPRELELLAQARADAARLDAEARAGDRAVFAWLWSVAEPDARAELDRRLRFLTFVQDRILALDRHRDSVVPLLSRADAVAELDLALAALHRDLRALLAAAEDLELPELRNLEAGASTRAFLLSDPLVEPHAAGSGLRAWLGEFMPQVTGVHERLRTLHAKNLGRLLALREQIEQREQDQTIARAHFN